MRYHQIIAESRDAPLFHGSPLPRLLNALSMNQLGTRWQVSLSRSYQVALYFLDGGEQDGWDEYGGVLVLDQRKLAQRYAIRPFHDEWATHSGHTGWADEQEERLLKPVAPLSDYLLSVNVNPKAIQRAMTDTRYQTQSEDFESEFDDNVALFQQQCQALLQHPLLNKYKPRVAHRLDPVDYEPGREQARGW